MGVSVSAKYTYSPLWTYRIIMVCNESLRYKLYVFKRKRWAIRLKKNMPGNKTVGFSGMNVTRLKEVFFFLFVYGPLWSMSSPISQALSRVILIVAHSRRLPTLVMISPTGDISCGSGNRLFKRRRPHL